MDMDANIYEYDPDYDTRTNSFYGRTFSGALGMIELFFQQFKTLI